MTNDAASRLIAALRSPGVYPHPAAKIELLQTHISWVLLTGEFAYKIKKPVDLGFVDFSTLEKRRRYCGEEIRLNRRLAPDIYLGVVPITGRPDDPHLGGTGDPFEYAVRMRQFPQDVLLSHLLEQGLLKPEHIDCLAREVAGFHAVIETATAESPFGTAEAVRKPIDENFRHLSMPHDNPRLSGQISRLKEWSDREWEARRDDFSARKTGGFVRECHGDMHLGNMVLLDREVTLFDCIEFNESFRWIDLLSEVAFCTMDLEDRGRPDLSQRFLNAYLEITGDYGGLCVFQYYLTYRSLVRAKVACLRLKQSGSNERKKRGLGGEFHSYLDLAERYTQPRQTFLAITHGLSGSGKSYGTQPFVEQLGAIRIRSDVERKRLCGLSARDRIDSEIEGGLYSREITQRTYARLAELAAAAIDAGFSAIIDAAFLQQNDRAKFRAAAGKLQVPFRILDFQADEETLRERIISRQRESRDASDADLEVLENQLASAQSLSNDELLEASTIDTSNGRSTGAALKTLANLPS